MNCRSSFARLLSGNAASGAHYRVLVVGGGTGGLAISSSLSRKLGRDKVAVIEPSDVHYYQPMFTLVGSGIKKFEQTRRPMRNVMPRHVTWIQDGASEFDPDNKTVVTVNGNKLYYDYLVVAAGLQIDVDKIKGLRESIGSGGISTNYLPDTVQKTWKFLEEFQGGEAVFTFPNSAVKCAGAPQKIMYLAEHRFRQRGLRDKSNVTYYTALPVIFGAKKYADRLSEIVDEKSIGVNYRHDLIEIDSTRKEAVFENLETKEKVVQKYDFMHVTPPMGPMDFLKASPLVDGAGWVDVDKNTLQHKRYPNVFGIGDCTNVPTSKTAAAVAGQSGVLKRNLLSHMNGQPLTKRYDGYTSCPLPVSYGKLLLAEFDFDGQPLETFPINQRKERLAFYIMKREILPHMYWNYLLKGHWEGTSTVRKLLHLGTSV
ncbi:sulfide:quinone oxidoreductase, mitochondrial-like [Corticium candelabrum]|uniref:sulfide:quinone oxidoreductase, mitochondrial-like n=1 Tax=Corticium candelabrum TaxID=121492 RepID=UPI002E257E9F|nr:sulfide:quinone oxidoreductase, mitochondrial-like [Corticium candelabrum]